MDDLSRANWRDAAQINGLVRSYEQRYGPPFWNAIEELIGPASRERIIDLGCGAGLFLVDAIRRLGAQMVYGVDASEEMLAKAREHLISLSRPVKFELIAIDLEVGMLPIPRTSVDLIFCGFVLHELRNPATLLKLAHSLLRSDGVCIVFDYVSGNKDAFVKGMVSLGMNAIRAQKRYRHMCKHSINDLIELLLGAGFNNVHERQIDDYRAIVIGVKA